MLRLTVSVTVVAETFDLAAIVPPLAALVRAAQGDRSTGSMILTVEETPGAA